MFSNHIHAALAQVRELQRQVLERQRFRGYSDKARAASGGVAMLAAIILASPRMPRTELTHLMVWLLVFLFALIANYGAVTYWFLNDPKVKRDIRKLKPTLDVFPPLGVGAILTLALVLRGDFHYLFGIWMCLFGLANLASRHVLPRPIAYVGLYYLTAGTLCLFIPPLTFTNPWPMGVVFFLGEGTSGIILRLDQRRKIS